MASTCFLLVTLKVLIYAHNFRLNLEATDGRYLIYRKFNTNRMQVMDSSFVASQIPSGSFNDKRLEKRGCLF